MTGELLAVASLLLFSANVLLLGKAGRRLPQELGFLLALGSNVAVGGVVALAQYSIGGQTFAPEWDAIGLFVLGGALTSYVGRWFFFRSVQTIGPTRASALQITNPVFAALAALLLLDEALPPRAVVCGLLVLLGLYLTSRHGPGSSIRRPPARLPRSPAIETVLALLGAAAYGLGNVARGAGVRDWAAPVFGTLLGATAALILYSLLHSDVRKLSAAIRGADPLGRRLWLLSGVLTISAQTCLMAASLFIPVAVAVVISAAVPIVVLPVGVLFLKNVEALRVSTAVGAFAVLAGVAGLVLR